MNRRMQNIEQGVMNVEGWLVFLYFFLIQTLTENMDATLEESVDELVQKLIAWRGDDHFTDDVSLFGLEMRGG